MANSSQCPQCGAANSVKLSSTEYHCTYCDSNFTVGMTKEEMMSTLFKKSTILSPEMADRIAHAKALHTPEALAAMQKKAKKVGIIIVLAVFLFLGILFSVIFLSVRSSISDSLANSYWGTPSVTKFHVFSGSKGPVLWYILNQSSDHLDSAKYTLRIVNPKNNTTLSEFNIVPVMTWKDGFNSGNFIGDFFAYGDTCWNATAENGLVARDIYTGKIIIDGKKLGVLYPKLAVGVTKASYTSYEDKFEITTTDGFEFYFSPRAKQIFTKEEWEKAKDNHTVTKTFFVLSDEKRPRLFTSIEKTSLLDISSKAYSNYLAQYEKGKRPEYLNKDVLTLTQIIADKTFFNGWVEYADNEKAIVCYSESIAKKSPLHLLCVDAAGKMLWDNSGKEINDAFQEIFANNNRGIEFVNGKDAFILYYQYGNQITLGLDWKTGKILWKHEEKKL